MKYLLMLFSFILLIGCADQKIGVSGEITIPFSFNQAEDNFKTTRYATVIDENCDGIFEMVGKPQKINQTIRVKGKTLFRAAEPTPYVSRERIDNWTVLRKQYFTPVNPSAYYDPMRKILFYPTYYLTGIETRAIYYDTVLPDFVKPRKPT